MRGIISTVILALVLLPCAAMAMGDRPPDPAEQQIKQRIAAYQVCFYKGLPQAMEELNQATPDEALADKALANCAAELDDLRIYLSGIWDDPEMAAVAADEVRATTRKLALEDFQGALEDYPDRLNR